MALELTVVSTLQRAAPLNRHRRHHTQPALLECLNNKGNHL